VKAKGARSSRRPGRHDKALEGKAYITGSFSVADAALFYVDFGPRRMGIRGCRKLCRALCPAGWPARRWRG